MKVLKRVLVFSLVLVLMQAGIKKVFASESRANALSYNLAFEDDTDVFTFPQLLTNYKLINFYLPSNIKNVYGGMIFKTKSYAIGAFVHRPFYQPFEQYRLLVVNNGGLNLGVLSNASQRFATTFPGQVFDVIYSNGKLGLGLRFHGWSEVSKQQGDLGDTGVPNNFMHLFINGGYKLSETLNTRFIIGIGNIKDNGTTITLSAGARSIEKTENIMKKVFAFDVEFAMFSPKDGDGSYMFAIPLKYGFRIHLVGGKLVTGLLGGVDIQYAKIAGGDGQFGIAVPLLELATEYQALSWLYLRTSIKGGYGFLLSGDPDKNNPKFEQMIFNSGLGFNLGNFIIDATLSYSVWQNGIYLLSGNTGLFGNVTLTFKY